MRVQINWRQERIERLEAKVREMQLERKEILFQTVRAFHGYMGSAAVVRQLAVAEAEEQVFLEGAAVVHSEKRLLALIETEQALKSSKT